MRDVVHVPINQFKELSIFQRGVKKIGATYFIESFNFKKKILSICIVDLYNFR
jgi:hypothetical protein